VPRPWVVGLIGLTAGVLFEAAPRGAAEVAVIVALWAGLAVLAARWVVRAAWTPRHTLAAASAALMTYAWHAFVETPVVPALPVLDLVGNAIFALGAALLVGIAWHRTATIELISTHR
jgi:hypothetical protein